MIIRSYYINGDNEIAKYEVDTSSEKYISHTDHVITLTHGKVYICSFQKAKRKLIKYLMKRLEQIKKLKEPSL